MKLSTDLKKVIPKNQVIIFTFFLEITFKIVRDQFTYRSFKLNKTMFNLARSFLLFG